MFYHGSLTLNFIPTSQSNLSEVGLDLASVKSLGCVGIKLCSCSQCLSSPALLLSLFLSKIFEFTYNLKIDMINLQHIQFVIILQILRLLNYTNLLLHSIAYLLIISIFQGAISSVQPLNHVQLFATPWTAACYQKIHQYLNMLFIT